MIKYRTQDQFYEIVEIEIATKMRYSTKNAD